MTRKNHRGPDPQQLGMDFSSRAAERFALLRSLDLGISTEASRLAYLLELIAAIAGDGELDWTLKRISERLRLPETNLKRTIALAEQIGAITVRRLQRKDGTYGANALAVNWPRIARGEIDRLGAHKRRRAWSSQRPTGPDRQVRLASPSGPVGLTSSPGISSQEKYLQENPPPPPPRELASALDSSRAGMVAAVVRLCELGVADASAACRQAAASGVTADVVLALAEHFAARPGAWGPGALHYRVRSAVPGQAVEQGWPPASRGYAPPEALAARQLRERAAADQAAARAASEAELARRQRALGPRLAALSDEQLAALVAGNPFMQERLARSGRDDGILRDWLLARLAELSPESTEALP